VTVIPEALRSH